MNIKLRPRTNGQTDTPKWEQDDELDKLAKKLSDGDSDGIAATNDDIPMLPPMKPPAEPKRVVVEKPQPAPPPKTVNVVELVETLIEAYTAPDVRMWIEGGTLCFEQVVREGGSLYKNQFRLKIASYETSSLKLIK